MSTAGWLSEKIKYLWQNSPLPNTAFSSGNSCGIIFLFKVDKKVQVLWKGDPVWVVAIVLRMAVLAKEDEVVGVCRVEDLG